MNTDSNRAVLEFDEGIPLSIPLDPDLCSDDLASRAQRFRLNTARVALISLLICIVCLLAALGWPLLTGQVYTADDLGWFHLPMRSFYAQQLAHGQPFDWCPEMFSGFCLTGEGQVGTYHPLHWLLYRALPLSVAFDLECWLSYPFMLLGMYLFLRRWKLRQEAAAFGALVFTFGSFNLLHLIHLNGVAIVAHLPWLLWAIDVMLRSPFSYQTGENCSAKISVWKRNRRLALCGVALLTGSQLLLGYPQYVLFSLVVEAGYVLLLSTVAGASLFAAAAGVFRWTTAVLIGALIGGVQLLPTFESLVHSVRQSTAMEDFATQGSMPLLNWMQLVTPYLFATRVVGGITHEFGMYMGAVPLALAAWWICSGKRGEQYRALTIAALATATVALLWMMGGLGPLGWLQEHLPLVNRFRLPCRAIVVFQLAIAVLAALGFAMLLETAGNSIRREDEPASPFPVPTPLKRKDRRPLLWTLPLVSAVFSLLALRYWRPYLAPYPLLVALGPVMMAAAVCLVLRANQGARWAVAALVVLSAVDLGVYGMSYSVYGHVESLPKYIAGVDAPPGFPSKSVVLDLASGTEAAPGQKTVRSGDQILLKGWNRVDGYAGLDPAKQLDYRDPAALRAAGVEWIAGEAATQIQNSGHSGWMAKTDRKKMVADKPIYAIGKN
ncbi:MAG TPA: hypothetical protein VMJ32_06690, partial [Pirellulales bacterium]|nr:hypothetical protein [Pirellulales bacterium]